MCRSWRSLLLLPGEIFLSILGTLSHLIFSENLGVYIPPVRNNEIESHGVPITSAGLHSK